MTKKDIEKIQKTAEKLFKLLEIEGVVEALSRDEGVDVTLQTEDGGMIIGHHGETLDALQLVLSLVVAKELGEFVRVTLEVGDYRKSREEWLKTLAASTKEKALSQQRPITLPMLKAWERRVIHLMFQEDEEVASESVGEGRDRVLVVKPR